MPREHPLSLHRVLPLALVGVLALLALAAIFGPHWYQRLYHPVAYREVIGGAARRSNIDPYLLLALVHAESGFDPQVVSKRGAVGLTQVMPETADDIMKARGRKTGVSVKQLKNPEFNVEIGAEYLAQLRERYDGDYTMALAAYNAGIVNADRWEKGSGDPAARIDFPQTRHYVDKVLKERDSYKKLYPEAYPWQK